MAGIEQYVRDFGNVPFTELPFGEADSFVFCNAFYAPLETIVNDEFQKEPGLLRDAVLEYYALCNYKYKAVGLILTPEKSRMLVSFADHKRYGELRVTGARPVYDKEQGVQFAAATFFLPTGENVVVFRGTDDTFTGWLEDVDLLRSGEIPSFRLAVDYISEVARRYDGDIIITGHSKGGIVALHAALGCSDEVFARIKGVYNNDGPGFADRAPYDTPRYKALLPKYHHTVPNNSFVGMMLAHDDDYNVVKSSRITGPFQHDIITWQIVGTEPVWLADLTTLGQINKLWFERVFDDLNAEQVETMYEIFFNCVNAAGTEGLLSFAKNIIVANSRILKELGRTDPAKKKTVKETNKFILASFVGAAHDVLSRKAPIKVVAQ